MRIHKSQITIRKCYYPVILIGKEIHENLIRNEVRFSLLNLEYGLSFLIFYNYSFPESGYQRLYVTYNGRLLDKFTREGAVAALTLQFATLYNYGVSFTHSGKNKALPMNLQNYFDFCTVYEWGIRTKFLSSGTGKPIQKRVSGECQKLFNAISNQPN